MREPDQLDAARERRLRADVEAENERLRLRLERRDLTLQFERTQRRDAERGHEEARQRLAGALAMREFRPPKRPIKPRGTQSSPAMVPVFLFSDWHVEENVDPRTINGLNAYNPKIAEARGRYLAQSCVALLDMWRRTFTVKTITIGLLGDLITGYIHEELRESNWLSPTEALLLAQQIIVPGVEAIFDESGVETIHVICSWGNHGRTQPKRVIQTAAQNSFEWLLYQWLATYFHNSARDIRFYVAEGYHTFLDIYDTTLRFHHGDWVRYQGGVGGLSIPLNKAIAKWNEAKRAAVDVLGHWHQLKDDGAFIVNGSMIGFNSYALSIKAQFQPPLQSAFTVRPGRGKDATYKVFVEEPSAAASCKEYVRAHPQWITPPGAIVQ